MRYLIRSFTYNGQEKPEWLLLNKVNRPLYAAISPVTTEVPGRRGSYFFENKTGSKEITIDIEIMAENDNDLWIKAEWLIEWLDQGQELPLSFNDEPERFYMAVFTGGGDAMEQIAATGRASISFLCPDPYKYGLHANYDLGDGTNTAIINYNGTAPMYPKLTVTFTKDSNYFAFAGPEGFIQYGAPAAIDEVAVKPKNKIFVDQMADLAPWSSSGVNIDFGMQAGAFRVQDGHKFVVDTWGDDDATTGGQWHGPVLKRALPNPVQDFRAVFDIDFNNPPGSAGRICLWLLDAAGAIIGRLIFFDKYLNAVQNEVSITAGPNSNQAIVLAHKGFPDSKSLTWNGSFIGRLVLNRNGNIWRASIAKMGANGRLSTASYAYDWIQHGAHLNPIAQIQVGIMKYGNAQSKSFYSAIREVLIEELNSVPAGAPETVFQAGDVLDIDFNLGAAWLNGEYCNDLLDVGSRFFPILPGVSELAARGTDPAGFTVNIDYDNRYK